MRPVTNADASALAPKIAAAIKTGDPSVRNVGTGVSVRAVGGYATGGGTWTQDFALGMHQSAPSGNTGPMNGCPY